MNPSEESISRLPPVGRLARLAATGCALAAWLFMARVAHGAAPSRAWWLGLAVAAALVLPATLLGRRVGVRGWGPVVAGAAALAIFAAVPRLLEATLAAAAVLAAFLAVRSWMHAGSGRPRMSARMLEPLGAGAVILAGLVPPAAAPVISAIAFTLLAATLAWRLLGRSARPVTVVLGLLAPAALLAAGLLWPGIPVAWLAGPVCVLGLLAGEA